ncbi:RNA 2',3'-cyclic phosphodiesterase [Anaerocolumna sp. AGMB13025]|uniref:RNA 2',3'-cyclic phosphodiesterase n=1 Tax=Anaerocolumna sp. AGMB13025 TaxID=3039116 RepID=UPI00241BF4C0|nr:RNA 2',3'-cyclic phosphodiesterase [Anaerocolumna sp. AGMB13025]WFR59382.1 RNA 2',3'-cyclic phosphodiesterase [Anaerocolumna sp. AGMB13025]
MKELMRLFIAINFNEKIKTNLYELTQELKGNITHGHVTHKDNFHLTLVFIGETKDYEHARQAMEQAVSSREIPSFLLNFGGFGRFKGRSGDIYWVGVEPNPVLTELNQVLVKELRKFEFYIEEREYKPHLTLGRDIKLKQGFSVNDFEKLVPEMSMSVREIGLMKSERINGKLVYTEIYKKNLMV